MPSRPPTWVGFIAGVTDNERTPRHGVRREKNLQTRAADRVNESLESFEDPHLANAGHWVIEFD